MKRKGILSIAAAAAVLAALGGAAVFAQDKQDKYALTTPSGSRSPISRDTRTGSGLLRPDAQRPAQGDGRQSDDDQGLPGRHSRQRPAVPQRIRKIAKLQWKIKTSTEAPFDVNVPDTFAEAFLMEKDSKRFPDTGGWGYAQFNYDPATDRFTPDAAPANCGHTCHVAVTRRQTTSSTRTKALTRDRKENGTMEAQVETPTTTKQDRAAKDNGHHQFLQQEWVNDGDFIGVGRERDPIIGRQEEGVSFTIPQEPARRRVHGIETFNVLRGGEYLFLPSISALNWLASLRG